MEREFLKSESSFIYKFEEKSEINASALTTTLNSLIELINIATLAEDSDAYARLTIKAIEKGSFRLDLSAVVNTARNLLTAENIQHAANVVQLIVAFFEIKKHVKKGSCKIKKNGNQINVINQDGEVKEFPARSEVFFHGTHVENLVINCVTVAAIEGIPGINISSQAAGTAVKRKDYESMTIPMKREEVVLRTKEYTKENIRLTIKKADFIGNSRWTFVYENSIDVTIKDEEWLHWFKSSKANVCSGSYIIADLTIITEVDETGKDIPGTEKYEIRKVKSKIIFPDADSEQQVLKID